MTREDAVVRRIRARSIVIAVVCALGGFLFGWRSGLSLTICAGVVIFSFLVFEKLTERLVFPRESRGMRGLVPLLLVTAGAVLLLWVVLRWKAFDPVAGAVGLSAVVLGIAAEIFRRGGGAS